jgi:hypothetical protein
MGTYFVAGGIYRDLNGNEIFSLVCPSYGELPYVMDRGIKPYFRLIWLDAHIYQVEEDYTLALIDSSPQALQNGVMAPERVTPGPDLSKRLQTALEALHASSLQYPSYFPPLDEKVSPGT